MTYVIPINIHNQQITLKIHKLINIALQALIPSLKLNDPL